MFAGNIQDETTFFIEEDLNNTLKYVTTFVPIDNVENADSPGSGRIVDFNGFDSISIAQYFKDCGVKVKQLPDGIVAYDEDVRYDSIIGSSLLRSLRRDDVYKYGVVYYDKYGSRSNVIPIKAP